MLRYGLYGAGDAMNLRQAAEMALEALVNFGQGNSEPAKALSQALAQPEQEPVAWVYNGILHEFDPSEFATSTVTPLYIAPPKREWVGLTDDEIGWLWHNSPPNSHEYARAIEAKLKEKNSV